MGGFSLMAMKLGGGEWGEGPYEKCRLWLKPSLRLVRSLWYHKPRNKQATKHTLMRDGLLLTCPVPRTEWSSCVHLSWEVQCKHSAVNTCIHTSGRVKEYQTPPVLPTPLPQRQPLSSVYPLSFWDIPNGNTIDPAHWCFQMALCLWVAATHTSQNCKPCLGFFKSRNSNLEWPHLAIHQLA